MSMSWPTPFQGRPLPSETLDEDMKNLKSQLDFPPLAELEQIKEEQARVEMKIDNIKHLLKQRSRQVELGKSTVGYQRYIKQVPREKRVPQLHPSTPNIYLRYSNRQFKGVMKQWRRKLHDWDPPGLQQQYRVLRTENLLNSSGSESGSSASESSQMEIDDFDEEDFTGKMEEPYDQVINVLEQRLQGLSQKEANLKKQGDI